MASFEQQKSEERRQVVERALQKTMFIKKAIEQSQSIHEDRKQKILAS